MNIVCATDDNYVQHCGVMLTSLFENNRDEIINVYLLTEGLSNESMAAIQRIIERYNAFFYYCQINAAFFDKCPIRKNDHVSIATYYRFVIPQVLPLTESKVLYLDCDIIIRKQISELWNIDLTDYAIAAVDETICQSQEVFRRLQYDAKYGYFNAGVMLINVEYWRQNSISENLFNYVNLNTDKIILHDQDTLNAVLHDCWLPVVTTWNMGETFYRACIEPDNQELFRYLKDPAILHYTWRPKPWNYGSCHPLKNEYFKYLALTQWRNFRVRFDLNLYMISLVKRVLVTLKIRKPFYKEI